MPYKGEGNDTRKSGTTTQSANVSGKDVYAPLGALKVEKTTDTSSFIERDKERGITGTSKRVSNEVRKA